MSDHGTVSAYSHGCRCDDCRDAHRAYTANRRAARLAEPVPGRAHGTEGGYVNWGCRCDQCREAHRAYMAAQYASRLTRGLTDDDPRHGTVNGYVAWGCRCAACRATEADRQARRRAACRAS